MIGWMGGCPPLLDSAGSEPRAPWVQLMDGVTTTLTEKANSSEGIWGNETQQCPRGSTADQNAESHVSPSLSWSHSLRCACLCSSWNENGPFFLKSIFRIFSLNFTNLTLQLDIVIYYTPIIRL